MDPNAETDKRTDEETGQQDHPEQEAHGGSMAPDLVDDTGHQRAEVPRTSAEE
jgi:hypothetical protein